MVIAPPFDDAADPEAWASCLVGPLFVDLTELDGPPRAEASSRGIR